MATTITELKRLQREIETIKKKVARLEERGNGKRRVVRRKRQSPAPRLRQNDISDRERAHDILRRGGITREMTLEENRLAAEWDVLPEEEKRQVEATLRRVHLEPLLSQLVHEMRG